VQRNEIRSEIEGKTTREQRYMARASLGFLFAESVGQPVETFVQTVTGSGASRLDVPLTLAQLVEAQALGNLVDRHSVG